MLFIFSTLVLIRHPWQFKTVVFLHWCLISAVPFQSKQSWEDSDDESGSGLDDEEVGEEEDEEEEDHVGEVGHRKKIKIEQPEAEDEQARKDIKLSQARIC
jgi:hypothetical protein